MQNGKRRRWPIEGFTGQIPTAAQATGVMRGMYTDPVSGSALFSVDCRSKSGSKGRL